MRAMLKVNDVKKTYKTKKYGKTMSVQAVSGVAINIGKGKCIGLVGESGCGKSTLGRMIAGLERPDGGSISLNGTSMLDVPRNKRKLLRKEIQIVFQDSISSVDPRLNAKEIISEPLVNFCGLQDRERDLRVNELLEMVCVSAEDKYKYPFQFSGGQLQRICLARALAGTPSLIVLDEPLSSLDVSVQAQILNLLDDIKKATDVSYLLISHDLQAVYYLSDSMYIMYAGLIMESIEDIDYFGELRHPYSRRLLALHEKQAGDHTDIEEAADSDDMTTGCPYYLRCLKRTGVCKISLPALETIKNGHQIRCHNYR